METALQNKHHWMTPVSELADIEWSVRHFLQRLILHKREVSSIGLGLTVVDIVPYLQPIINWSVSKALNLRWEAIFRSLSGHLKAFLWWLTCTHAPTLLESAICAECLRRTNNSSVTIAASCPMPVSAAQFNTPARHCPMVSKETPHCQFLHDLYHKMSVLPQNPLDYRE